MPKTRVLTGKRIRRLLAEMEEVVKRDKRWKPPLVGKRDTFWPKFKLGWGHALKKRIYDTTQTIRTWQNAGNWLGRTLGHQTEEQMQRIYKMAVKRVYHSRKRSQTGL